MPALGCWTPPQRVGDAGGSWGHRGPHGPLSPPPAPGPDNTGSSDRKDPAVIPVTAHSRPDLLLRKRSDSPRLDLSVPTRDNPEGKEMWLPGLRAFLRRPWRGSEHGALCPAGVVPTAGSSCRPRGHRTGAAGPPGGTRSWGAGPRLVLRETVPFFPSTPVPQVSLWGPSRGLTESLGATTPGRHQRLWHLVGYWGASPFPLAQKVGRSPSQCPSCPQKAPCCGPTDGRSFRGWGARGSYLRPWVLPTPHWARCTAGGCHSSSSQRHVAPASLKPASAVTHFKHNRDPRTQWRPRAPAAFAAVHPTSGVL